MWYTYVLESETDKKHYTGVTNDLNRRLEEHNAKQGGVYTSKNGPFRIIFYEAYLDKKDASKAELFYKSGYGREVLKGKIFYYLNNKN
jgi:putative endonuclease